MKPTKVVCTFPYCDNKRVVEERGESVSILDVNVNDFITGQAWSDFPQNMVDYMKDGIGYYDYVIVEIPKPDLVLQLQTLNAMTDAGLRYTFVYPCKDLREEWVGRCYMQTKNMGYCYHMMSDWQELLRDAEQHCIKNKHNTVQLRHNETLAHALSLALEIAVA